MGEVVNYILYELSRWPLALRSLLATSLIALYITSTLVLGVYAAWYVASFVEFLRRRAPRPWGFLKRVDTYGYPRVGIVVPVYNDYEVLSSINKIVTMEYPHAVIVIADDSSDDYLSHQLSNIALRSNGKIIHLKRKERRGLKAGALNEAIDLLLDVYAVDYVLILDADFEPPRDMLYKLVSLAVEKRADLVQGYQRHVKGSDTLFGLLYRSSMAGAIINLTGRQWLDLFPIFTGSCGLISSRVLREVRFPEDSLAEDWRLTIDAALRFKDFRVVVTHEAYANGSVPRDQKTFWRQQIRWAVGTISEFIATFRKVIRAKHFTATAKAGYVIQGLYFTNGVWTYLNTVLPWVLIYLGMWDPSLVWPLGAYFWLIGIETLIIAGALMEDYRYMRSFLVAGYMILMIYYMAFIHAFGTLQYLLTGRKTWKVTAKRGEHEALYA